jgi:pSer/pThr/pTyr-binding forkhead associated (FHA) protein
MKICPKCSWENKDDFNFCLGCGCQLQSSASKGSAKIAQTHSHEPLQAPSSIIPFPHKDFHDINADKVPSHPPQMNIGSSQIAKTNNNPQFQKSHIQPNAIYNQNITPQESDDSRLVINSHVIADSNANELSCPKCANQIPLGYQFCGRCGEKISSSPFVTSSTTPPSSSVQAKNQKISDAPAKLVLMLPNGEDGGSYPLKKDITEIGRTKGNILFLDDQYISPLHATFQFKDNQLYVKNENSINGIFVQLRTPINLNHGDVILLGKQLLRFEKITSHEKSEHPEQIAIWGSPYSNYWGRLVQLLANGLIGNSILLGGNQIELGRERGQITFPGDRFISSIHAKIYLEEQQICLEDVRSRNGTFIQIRDQTQLKHKDVMIIGEQLLRVEIS